MTSSSHPTATSVAPWKPLFESHVSKMPSPELFLATVTHDGLPRTRTCIHRGFFASPLPENKHNTYPPNPHVYDSDCPAFTTDARMSKVYDIFATGPGKGTLEQSRSGTGGGGYVEACYWVKDTVCQWRITGRCWLLAADDLEGSDSAGSQQNSGTVTVKAELQRYLRHAHGYTNDKEKEWSWKREVFSHFANLSPVMRGSFKNPPPGTPVSDESGDNGKEKMGQPAEQDLDDEPVARRNFRVAVIAPEVVEMIDLSDPEKSRRTKWTLNSSEAVGGGDGPGDGGIGKPLGEWQEVKLWP